MVYQLQVRSIKAIGEGDEVTLNYRFSRILGKKQIITTWNIITITVIISTTTLHREEGTLTREERRKSLNENFNFLCQCVACQRSFFSNFHISNWLACHEPINWWCWIMFSCDANLKLCKRPILLTGQREKLQMREKDVGSSASFKTSLTPSNFKDK